MPRVTFRSSALTFLLAALGACSPAPEGRGEQDASGAAPSNTNALSPFGNANAGSGAAPAPGSTSATASPTNEGPPPALLAPSEPVPAAPAGGEQGLLVGGGCYSACGFASITDPDGDGFGRERQATCVDPNAAAAASAASCVLPAPADLPAPGAGVFTGDVCHPLCSSVLTDPDASGLSDGYGYERQRSCVVPGTATALGGLPCDPMLPGLPLGDGISVDGDCRPLCLDAAQADPDGYGFENNLGCVVSASRAALQGVPCTLPDPPPPPPPPEPPPGDGWNADYTATMFGEVNCQPFGFDDPGNSNLNQATCVGRGAVQLNAQNQTYFGALGDLSTLWSGGQCTCSGGQANADRCNTAPGCGGQANCGQCVEVSCNAGGVYSFMDGGFTHNEFCRPGRSVVVQLLDACPHNHPNNPYWCTRARPNHIDVSCSAFSELAEGRPVGEIGSINVYVRPVNCNVGLGLKTF